MLPSSSGRQESIRRRPAPPPPKRIEASTVASVLCKCAFCSACTWRNPCCTSPNTTYQLMKPVIIWFPANGSCHGAVPDRVHRHRNQECLQKARIEQHRHAGRPVLLHPPERACRQRGPRHVSQRRLNAAQPQQSAASTPRPRCIAAASHLLRRPATAGSRPGSRPMFSA